MGEGGIPSWAVRGAKVVCVDSTWQAEMQMAVDCGYGAPPRVPALHEIATIHHIITDFPDDCQPAGGCGLAFEGYPDGWGFAIAYFRPLIARTVEQDISEHFKPLLDAEPPLVRIPHRGTVRA